MDAKWKLEIQKNGSDMNLTKKCNWRWVLLISCMITKRERCVSLHHTFSLEPGIFFLFYTIRSIRQLMLIHSQHFSTTSILLKLTRTGSVKLKLPSTHWKLKVKSVAEAIGLKAKYWNTQMDKYVNRSKCLFPKMKYNKAY